MSLDDLPTDAPPPGARARDGGPARRPALRRCGTRSRARRNCGCSWPTRSCAACCRRESALDETDIARRFNVSRTPVREALRQLVASGLVEARAHRGAVVARPSLDRLTGMFEAMAELEALCAGLAAERMPPAERQKLEAIHEELRVLSHAGNPERFHEVNERFHNAIYAGSQKRLHRRNDAGDAGAGAAVPPRPVPQSRAAGEIARRARPRRGRDHARRQDRRGGRDARPYRTGARRIRASTRCRCRTRANAGVANSEWRS